MAGMSRSILIVSVAVIALIYGAFQYLPKIMKSGQTAVKTTDPLIEVQNVVALAVTELTQNEVTDPELYAIKAASNTWKGNIFVRSNLALSATKGVVATEQQGPAFHYTGYLKLNGTMVAFIDGIEYQVNDELESGGYTVQSIEKTHVTLKPKGPSVGKEVVVPIEEDQPLL